MLAPVIREKKGEHVHLFEELRAQGFIRVRIDGRIYDMDDTPDLDKNKKHTIEVVVDRFKVRDDLQNRLAESFETALNLADDIAVIAPMDGDGEETTFSAKFACPSCGYSIPELEPRLFSFNNPAGACPSCDGLGMKQFFDEGKVINSDELSLSEGAIRGWDRRNVYYFQMLHSLSQSIGFDMDAAFKDLPKEVRKKVLHGTGKESIEFRYLNDRGDIIKRNHPFEGIIPNMERRYRETESDPVREDLLSYMSTSSCPSCNGSRLREAARHVFIDQTLSLIHI